MSDDKVVLELSLDDKEYIEKLLKAKKQLQSLGDKKNTAGAAYGIDDLTKKLKDMGSPEILTRFTGNFLKMAGPISVVTGSVFALKSAFDAALEGERIKAVDAQFQQLASNIGLSASKLKSDFMGAVEGELSMTESLKLANDAMIKLGSSAKRLPEIMELAQQRSVVMGEDLTQSFSEITNALASGNERALKKLGLSVDTKKAIQDYAKDLGVTVSSLSEAGKKQAVMNAALEAGKAKFQGITQAVTPLSQSLDRLGGAFGDLTDYIKKSIAGFTGFKAVIDFVATGFRNLGDDIKIKFGNEADAATGKISALRTEIKTLETGLQGEVPKAGFFSKLLGVTDEDLAKQREVTQQMIDDKKAQIEELKKTAGAQDGGTGKTVDDSAVNTEAQREQASKFQKELISMRQARADAEIQIAANETQLIQAENEKRIAMAADLQSQIVAIELSDNTPFQKMQLIEEAQKMHSDKMVAFERDEFQRKEAMWENYQKTSTSVLEGIARAAVQEGQKQNRALTNSGEVGKKAFTDLSNLGATAFDAIGRAAVNGAGDMGKAMLGAIGTIASSWGKMMMLAAFSTWPAVQGPKLAAGAALMVLGGVLGAASSGGGGGVSASAGGSADLSSGSVVSSDRQDTAKPLMDETAMQKKQVSLVVQGNIYETDQTRQRLVELIREASDATDFRYNQIGK